MSRFIFGTGSLTRVGSAAARRRLLETACAHGFTHFDTAPYYGFGLAERDLAPVLAAHPGMTVTTKVGLYAPGGEGQSGLSVVLRKAAGRLAPALSRPEVDWTVRRACRSLEGSLARLGRPQVDLFMLHEPIAGLLDTDEWLGWLDAEVRRGRVRRFGLAADARNLASFGHAPGPLGALIQTADSLDSREADRLLDGGRPLQITYGYVSAARRQRDGADVPAILSAALRRNRTGAIIVTTRRLERVPQYARLAGAPS